MAEVINQQNGEMWQLYNGDCCEMIRELPDESIGYSLFSPPFVSLFVYSDSERDMGNCESSDEFFEHFRFLIRELYRVLKPGRLCSVHCMNMPSSKSHDGFIGIKDFRGDIIRAFQSAEFIYHSEVCIWKDPVVAMQRTKALGLLHKQVCKDSSMSRQGIPDYICTFRKPDKNAEPIEGPFEFFAGDGFSHTGNYSIDVWQRYASPVWMDIRQSNTLNAAEGRSEKDERHVCPLQLDVIHRCCQLWSNEGDVVLSPFAGIGSEGVGAIKIGRKFIGFELKEEYFKVAAKNLRIAEQEQLAPTLFE
jgi:hypothetical protein